MTKNEFCDRYIQGERGGWYFSIELCNGAQISGGLFSLKQHARDHMLDRLAAFLDDTENFIVKRAPKRMRPR